MRVERILPGSFSGVRPHDGRATNLAPGGGGRKPDRLPGRQHGLAHAAAAPGLAAHKAFDLDDFVAEHNRNAENVQTLEAQRLAIHAMIGRHPANVNGRMALERPRNFKLELSSFGTTKADIGSNDEEFWYWLSNKEQPYVYWCNYADVETSSLAVTYQPEWIVEALGLRPIPPEEAAMIRVREGIEPGTSILTFPVVRDRGEPYSREMIVGNTDRRIKRLIIFSEKPRTRSPRPLRTATPRSRPPAPGRSPRTVAPAARPQRPLPPQPPPRTCPRRSSSSGSARSSCWTSR